MPKKRPSRTQRAQRSARNGADPVSAYNHPRTATSSGRPGRPKGSRDTVRRRRRSDAGRKRK